MTPTTEVRERPILFSGPMVRAILDGSKTQTRRVVNPNGGAARFIATDSTAPERIANLSPYGQPGDRLWVRETFAPRFATDGTPDENQNYVKYRADSNAESPNDPMDWHSWPEHWKPSIFMPRWACRITLEITEVRVQRLQEITGSDALAEGVAPSGAVTPMERAVTNVGNYQRLWDAINAKRGHSWESNPFVWAISFRRA